MTVPASNSLLKLLEEPPPATILLLSTAAPGQILPTIASRCQTIRFDALSENDIELALIHRWKFDEDNARFFSRLASGSLQRALAMAGENYEALRASAWNYLTLSVQGNQLERMDECDSLIQQFDKAGIQSVLQLLLTWLRDLVCLKSGVPEKMVNLDRESILMRFLQQYDDLDFGTALYDTERAIASLKKNVYLNLIVHTLSERLNKLSKTRLKQK